MEKRDYTKAADLIADRIACSARTLLYVRDMDAPNRDPKKTRERYTEWVRQTVIAAISES